MLGSLPSFARLESELGKLPGIGRKTAARLAFICYELRNRMWKH